MLSPILATSMFESGVRLTQHRRCPADDVDVIREGNKLERTVEDRATDVVFQPRASNDTFQGDVEGQTGESVALASALCAQHLELHPVHNGL